MHACSPLSRLLVQTIMRGPNQRGSRIEFALETWGRNASARPLFSPFQAKCIQWTYDLNSKFCGFRRFWWLALSVLASNVNHTGNVLGSVHCNFPAVHVHNARGTCMAWLHGLGNCRSKKAFVPWASDHSEPFPFFCSLLVRRALSWLYWLTSGGWFLLCSGCFRWWTVKSAFFAFVIERTPSFQRFIVHWKNRESCRVSRWLIDDFFCHLGGNYSKARQEYSCQNVSHGSPFTFSKSDCWKNP